MSRKGVDFGYVAKRHGTLKQRRERERVRKLDADTKRFWASISDFERDLIRSETQKEGG